MSPLLLFTFAIQDVNLASKEAGKWNASLEVKAPQTVTELTKFAFNRTTEQERKKFESFVKTASSDWKEYGAETSTSEYSYESTTKIAFSNANLCSYLASVYSYHGGAHGVGVTFTYNFGLVNGKPKQLTLKDFAKNSSSLKKIKSILWAKVKKNPDALWVSEGMVKEISPIQYERFWVNEKYGLVWEFDPYELTAYAYGPITHTITWKELRGLVKTDGLLLGLAVK